MLQTNLVRPGAARAITLAGRASAQRLMAGKWYSSAYRLYLDLGRKEARATASILIGAPVDESLGGNLSYTKSPLQGVNPKPPQPKRT